MIYENAEIYLTKCTHPDFKELRYLGLDTKKDPNYLGSSVALKWWINYLGRRYFKKTILERVTGTMSECCEVEQKYILEHDAISDRNYLNMNGERKRPSITEKPIDLYFVVKPKTSTSQDFVSNHLERLSRVVNKFTLIKRHMAKDILSMVIYGHLKYGQEYFEYNKYSNYGSCRPEDLQDILSGFCGLNILDYTSNDIIINEEFAKKIPSVLDHTHFTVTKFDN